MKALINHKRTSSKIILGSLLAVVLSRTAFGDVIVDDLSASHSGSLTIGSSGPVGQEFTMPDDGNTYNLDDIKLDLTGAAGNISVSIYTVGDDGSPGSLISLVGVDATPGGSTQNYIFTPTASISLSAGISYYMVAERTSSSGGALWYYTAAANVDPSGGSGTFANTGFESYNNTSGISTISSGSYGIMEVDATPAPTPEPSTLALLGLGVFGLVSVRGVRSRCQSKTDAR